jgi:hypothetical protein
MHDTTFERGEQQTGRGPEVYYGYCCDTKRMRMMDYGDYVKNIRRASADLYAAMYRNAQGSMRSWWETMHAGPEGGRHHERCGCGCGEHTHGHHHRHHHGGEHHHHDRGPCGCREHHEDDCHCECCIRDADAVEYTRCGETRLIPLLFENDTRRERDVKLDLGPFATSSGRELGWQAGFSESEFKLPPCGQKTVTLSVVVDCGRLTVPGNPDTGTDDQRRPTVDECKVGYATVRAEGCLVRPLVVAVAVLPNDCGAHRAGCSCGCCN